MWAAPDVGQDAAAARRRRRRQRAVRRSALAARHRQRHRRRRAGAEAAARLRRRPVARGARPTRRRCAKRRASTMPEMFRAAAGRTAPARKGRGAPPPAFLRTNCFACAETRGRRRRRPLARAAADAGRGVDGAALRSGPIGQADADRRDAGDAGRHSRGGRAQPAAAAGRRRRLHQADRLRLLPSQQRRLDGGRGRARARLRGQRGDGGRSRRRAIGTYLESWRERAVQNIPIAGGGRHDELPAVRPGRGSTIRPTPRPTRRRSG